MGFANFLFLKYFIICTVAGDEAGITEYYRHTVHIEIILTGIDNLAELVGSAGGKEVNRIGDGRTRVEFVEERLCLISFKIRISMSLEESTSVSITAGPPHG